MKTAPAPSEFQERRTGRDRLCRDAFVGVPMEIAEAMANGESLTVAELIKENAELQERVEQIGNATYLSMAGK